MESPILVFHNPDIRLGFHIAKEKTLEKTFTNMIDAPLKSYQICVCNARSYQPPKADASDLVKAKYILDRNGKYACVHGSLIYNLAGATNGTTDPNYNRNLQGTRNGLIAELDIAAGLGGGVVVHIGSSKDKKAGIKTITESVEYVLQNDITTTKILEKGLKEDIKSKRKVILENAAGEGNKIGSTLDEIEKIIKGVDDDLRDQVKVCIDTAHIFGAGQYDFGKPKSVLKFYDDFDKKIGLEKLEVFHLNDSRAAFGTKKDRHENIGLGYIFGADRDEVTDGDGLKGLEKFIEMAEYHRIPLIGEPPAKTRDKEPAPGGIWDYAFIREICNLEEEFVCD